jgi:hypothetical protein
MSELTPEQIEKYKHNPWGCPFCGSSDIEYEEATWDRDRDGYASVAECMKCKELWREVYSLVTIERICSECYRAECPGVVVCPKCGVGEHGEAAATHIADHGYCRECLRKWQFGEDNE